MNRSVIFILTLLPIQLPALGCGPISGGPEEDYRLAMEAAYRGDLAAFYDRLVPPSYDEDLNGLLDEVRKLVDEKEYQQARRLAAAFGERAAGLLEAKPTEGQTPLAGLAARSLDDLPGQMGLGSYEQFQQATVRSILLSLQQGALGKALKDPSVPVSWSRQRVELVEQSGEKARLRVVPAEPSSPPSETKFVDLVRVEGKWVPAELAAQWEGRIAQVRELLHSWQSQKERDPQFVANRLTALEQQLDYLSLLVPAILDSLEKE